MSGLTRRRENTNKCARVLHRIPYRVIIGKYRVKRGLRSCAHNTRHLGDRASGPPPTIYVFLPQRPAVSPTRTRSWRACQLRMSARRTGHCCPEESAQTAWHLKRRGLSTPVIRKIGCSSTTAQTVSLPSAVMHLSLVQGKGGGGSAIQGRGDRWYHAPDTLLLL